MWGTLEAQPTLAQTEDDVEDLAGLRARATELLGEELGTRVAGWVEADPAQVARSEVIHLVDAGDVTELTDRFSSRLEFGTAGLRGALGAGPNRMNRLVVRQAAAGLMAHLGPGARVVIGRDARHGSEEFAEDTARVVAALGGIPLVLPGPHPTPLVPFAVRHLGADAGVMVTASHNPPADNGYKVYVGDGAQIVPPVDAAIAHRIHEAARHPVELSEPDDPTIERLGDDVAAAYLEMVDRCRLVPDAGGARVVYTAMHGVGRDLLVAAFERAGYPAPHQVAEQVEPDPDFSTVAFPNPEEPGALDLALDLARRVQPDVVIAHDPDADRLGVAVPDHGDWRVLTGNEIGVLLADHILRHTAGGDRLVVTTLVSSTMLSKMAAAAGVRYVETLTGFKWIVRPALDDPTLRFVFGYEEALGYAVTPEVRDKDGITAAVLFAELVANLSRDGARVIDRLDQLAVEHGLHVGRTWSIRFDGAGAQEKMAALMSSVRRDPPTELAGHQVTRVHDHLEGGDLPPTDAVRLELGEQARILVRPSGTEPKAKVYLEVVEPTSVDTVSDDRRRALELVDAIQADLARRLGVTTIG
jgi:phosphomannomutase